MVYVSDKSQLDRGFSVIKLKEYITFTYIFSVHQFLLCNMTQTQEKAEKCIHVREYNLTGLVQYTS